MDTERIPLAPGGYELRKCGCDGGRVYESGLPSGLWVPCTDCGGTGEQKVYAYPRRTAKALVRVLAGGCADCGASGIDEELFPVPEDHLTFFSRDELCGECAVGHGVL